MYAFGGRFGYMVGIRASIRNWAENASFRVKVSAISKGSHLVKVMESDWLVAGEIRFPRARERSTQRAMVNHRILWCNAVLSENLRVG